MSERVFMVEALEKFIEGRIGTMEVRPEMWAATRYEFVVQLVLMVEMWHLVNEWAFSPDVAMRTILAPGSQAARPISRDWAATACAAAVGMLKRSP